MSIARHSLFLAAALSMAISGLVAAAGPVPSQEIEEARAAVREAEARMASAAADQALLKAEVARQPEIKATTNADLEQWRARNAENSRRFSEISTRGDALLAAKERLEQVEAERRASQPGFRSTDGYQKARWGMTRSEVRKLFPGARGDPKDKAIVQLIGETASLPSETMFYFAADRLTDVHVRLKPIGRMRSEREGFNALRDILIEKYGEPILDRSDDDRGVAQWQTDKTTIAIVLDPLSVFGRLMILYAGKEVAHLRPTLGRSAGEDL